MEMVTRSGQRIVQLRGEPPSHIVPAAFTSRRKRLERIPPHSGTAAGPPTPSLAEAARPNRRERFLPWCAITGVNFAVAETGGGRLYERGQRGSRPVAAQLHLPAWASKRSCPARDLALFLRLLARSARPAHHRYTRHFHARCPAASAHLPGRQWRSRILGLEEIPRALHCIPLRRLHEHLPSTAQRGLQLRTSIPGPLADPRTIRVCNSTTVPLCQQPLVSVQRTSAVKIDLIHQLFAWRQEIVR